jgi:hypothetical protein
MYEEIRANMKFGDGSYINWNISRLPFCSLESGEFTRHDAVAAV